MAPFGIFLLVFGKPSVTSFEIGLLLALCGEAIRLWGVGYAGRATRKEVLEAGSLVTAGPFAYVRHPLYLGNALSGLGGTIMAAGKLGASAAALFFLVFILFYGTIYGILMPLEEEFLEDRFGEAYVMYKKRTPRIIPAIFRGIPGSIPPTGSFSWSRAFASELHTLIPFFALIVLMALKIQ